MVQFHDLLIMWNLVFLRRCSGELCLLPLAGWEIGTVGLPVKGRWQRSASGKVTVGLASHHRQWYIHLQAQKGI